LAVGLSSVMLILRVVNFAQSYPHILERLRVLFAIVLPLHPVQVVHSEIVGTLFFIANIVFFSRRGFWRKL